MTFLYGILGFIGFEALRIYKCLWAKRPILPASKMWWYVCTVAVLGAFSGLFADAVSPDNRLEALYLGFSVPCGLKLLLDPSDYKRGLAKDDDITLEKPSLLSYFRHIYLGFG